VKTNHAVDAARYIKAADCPALKERVVLLIVCPVLAAVVSEVIACVLLNVTIMPSLGLAGIVIVPVANVPAGFSISVL
jgi:hypothetical protein